MGQVHVSCMLTSRGKHRKPQFVYTHVLIAGSLLFICLILNFDFVT